MGWTCSVGMDYVLVTFFTLPFFCLCVKGYIVGGCSMCLGVCQWGMMSLSPPEREEDVSLFGIISAEPTERAELLVTIPHRKKTKKIWMRLKEDILTHLPTPKSHRPKYNLLRESDQCDIEKFNPFVGGDSVCWREKWNVIRYCDYTQQQESSARSCGRR